MLITTKGQNPTLTSRLDTHFKQRTMTEKNTQYDQLLKLKLAKALGNSALFIKSYKLKKEFCNSLLNNKDS